MPAVLPVSAISQLTVTFDEAYLANMKLLEACSGVADHCWASVLLVLHVPELPAVMSLVSGGDGEVCGR